MKINFLVFCSTLTLFSCKLITSTNVKPLEVPFETIVDLQKYVNNNCRFTDFQIGVYSKQNTFEKFGLDSLQGKYIWYSNNFDKIIINTFLKEKYAVKYAYLQINKEFPELKGDITITIPSKNVEEKVLTDFKRKAVASNLIISFNDELGYSSEIEVSKCDSNKAIAILEKYPEVVIQYNE